MEALIFNSRSREYKEPFGCVYQNEKIRINVKVKKEIAEPEVILHMEGEESLRLPLSLISEAGDYDIYGACFSLSQAGLYFYCFKLNGEEISNGGKWWQISVLESGYETPDYLKGAVIYQIFPDRFNRSGEMNTEGKLTPFSIHESTSDMPLYRSVNGEVLNNDFFGGNLKGIEAKLSYLERLSVGIIYLNPIFFSYSNHRYDTADYMKIDPLLGTDEDFKSLCDAAHKRDMRIILDVAFSHTGSNSIYFDSKGIFGNGAVSNPASPYREWYDFQSYPDKYTSWWGIDTLPCVNELNPSFMEYITGEGGVLEKYLTLGADGFRLDVADELPDEFIIALQKRVKRVKKDAVIIGEVWEDASNKISYGVRKKYFTHCKMDSIMNYPLRTAVLEFVKGRCKAAAVSEVVMLLKENYPENVFLSLMNSLSTHDTLRAVTYFDAENTELSKDEQAEYKMVNEKEAKSKLVLAAAIMYHLPGCPTIYYGDEAGAKGFYDPFNRGYFPWDDMDSELIEKFEELGRLRKEYPALRFGSIEFMSEGEDILTFVRILDKTRIKCIANLSGEVYNLRVNTNNSLFSHKCSKGENICLIDSGGFYAWISDN